MKAWNLINFILILALFGIVIFLLIKRKKESYTYTPATQMNQNIVTNGNAIGNLQNETANITGKKGQIQKNTDRLNDMGSSIETEQVVIYPKGSTKQSSFQIRAVYGDRAGHPSDCNLEYCYSYIDSKSGIQPIYRNVSAAALKVETDPGSPTSWATFQSNFKDRACGWHYM